MRFLEGFQKATEGVRSHPFRRVLGMFSIVFGFRLLKGNEDKVPWWPRRMRRITRIKGMRKVKRRFTHNHLACPLEPCAWIQISFHLLSASSCTQVDLEMSD